MSEAENINTPLSFRPESPRASELADRMRSPHKVLLVDDDKEMHNLTRLVLQGYLFDGRGLEFLSAYSGREARDMISAHPDTALILLDVVMETDNAGLEVVRFIRDVLGNKLVRIVLRTGQPGQAPEREVILDYDINDYKEKTELTAQKLFTTVTASLRSYRDLTRVEESNQNMRTVTEASARLFEPRTPRALAQRIIQDLSAILSVSPNTPVSAFTARCDSDHKLHILVATGNYTELPAGDISPLISQNVLELLLDAVHNKRCQFSRSGYAGYIEPKNGQQHVTFFDIPRELSKTDRQMLTLYSNNAALAFDNIFLHQELIDTQSQIICMLGDAVEQRSKETGNHVRRMTELSCLLARYCGMPSEEVELLHMAAPLHDIGKIGIPDQILHKPGRLSDDEMALMRAHTTIGHDILKGSERPLFQLAARIALQHHEKWDGSGYPASLQGSQISLSGRVTALADVVDALGHKRCYKEAWKKEDILELINRERGKHFDPQVVDVFIAHQAECDEISARFP